MDYMNKIRWSAFCWTDTIGFWYSDRSKSLTNAADLSSGWVIQGQNLWTNCVWDWKLGFMKMIFMTVNLDLFAKVLFTSNYFTATIVIIYFSHKGIHIHIARAHTYTYTHIALGIKLSHHVVLIAIFARTLLSLSL